MQDVTMQWLMDDHAQPEAGLSLAKMTLSQGTLSEQHFHPDCNEVIHVLVGMIKQRIGDTWHQGQAGDTFFIPAGEHHQTRNIGDDTTTLMVAYSSGSRTYVKAVQ